MSFHGQVTVMWLTLTPLWVPATRTVREFIDYITSMIADNKKMRELLFYYDLGLFHTIHVLEERRASSGGTNPCTLIPQHKF